MTLHKLFCHYQKCVGLCQFWISENGCSTPFCFEMLERNGERACTYNSRFIYYQYKGGDICRINLVDNTFIVQIKQHTALSFIDLNRSFSLLWEPSYHKQVKPATIVTKMNKCIWHQSCFNKAMFYSTYLHDLQRRLFQQIGCRDSEKRSGRTNLSHNESWISSMQTYCRKLVI